MSKYTTAQLLFSVFLVRFVGLSSAQDQSDSDRYVKYWYCRADALTVEHPNYYSDIFKAPWRVKGDSRNQFSVITRSWERYLVKEQGFEEHENRALLKQFSDRGGDELYTARCHDFKTEQEAQYDKDHMESGVKLKEQGDARNRSRHVDTGWTYSADDDNQ